ncbi:Uncharacterized conserved protein YciI, contains a putative active-site phosphohistidine [Candidatus Pantoea varia]|uniref:Uncharacterized conserved protein YciI, contains a putative active-site phosphohistidine n=1 Tax=Candidatus Pantoea varia TaxID=1881036 RepID=A0A1I5EHE9_9GAMM|nr:YciI family protein [Pantoea varia]SFO10917.1 Uncharacterized conserved protein YciI, contains a putative active-site phosphohistidine [Pantoea varia]
MKFFLCKFIPPREDFLTTMSVDEAALMQQHADYLNDLLAKGLIVAHGPVLDPTGSYGLSLYQITDEEDVTTFTADDPIIKSGIGHYEHLQMPHLAARGC